jgi:hypothetical protein
LHELVVLEQRFGRNIGLLVAILGLAADVVDKLDGTEKVKALVC